MKFTIAGGDGSTYAVSGGGAGIDKEKRCSSLLPFCSARRHTPFISGVNCNGGSSRQRYRVLLLPLELLALIALKRLVLSIPRSQAVVKPREYTAQLLPKPTIPALQIFAGHKQALDTTSSVSVTTWVDSVNVFIVYH